MIFCLFYHFSFRSTTQKTGQVFRQTQPVKRFLYSIDTTAFVNP